MKKPLNPALPIDYTPKKDKNKQPEIVLDLKPCIVCNKQITQGNYGNWGDRGVCSKDCNTIQSQKPKYPPPHDEESYLKRHNLKGN
jgi:hypothetical protein